MPRMLSYALPLLVPLSIACGDDGSDPQPETAAASTTADPSTTTAAETTAAETTAAATTEPGTTAADTTAATSDDSTTGSGVEDLDMSPEDFVCLLEWEKVRRFRITNLLGRLPEALEVAGSPTGGSYPVGTVIQLIPNEAMVKRAAGWSPETNDWEFFSLQTSAAGTEILDRGTTEVINAFGGNCFSCHSAAEPQWDLICEQDHGCAPIPIDEATIEALQNGDPRCG